MYSNCEGDVMENDLIIWNFSSFAFQQNEYQVNNWVILSKIVYVTPIIYGRNFKFSELPYRKTSNISHTLVGNTIVDHSDVVRASPVGAAPTTSSFSA